MMIELYRKYLHNSLIGTTKAIKEKRLNEEYGKIESVLISAKNMFLNDVEIYDAHDRSIYTLIKKKIAYRIARDLGRADTVIYENIWYLKSVLNEITIMKSGIKEAK